MSSGYLQGLKVEMLKSKLNPKLLNPAPHSRLDLVSNPPPTAFL